MFALISAAAAVLQFDDTAPIREFILQRTDITIVDEPVRPRPVAYEATVDGRPGKPAARAFWYIKSNEVFRRILLDGALGLGETYMNGEWQTNDIERLCGEFLRLEGAEKELGWRALPLLGGMLSGALKTKFLPDNTRTSSPNNIAHHYDISAQLYKRMLGPTMMYTCAYFHRPGMSLDEAQRAKMQLVAKKLDLRPGLRILDLGCGFGSMAHFLAEEYGVHVTGVTLSKDQVDFAHSNLAHPMLDIRLQDYRDVSGTYDRVYSIGIFEHLGREHYSTYFDKVYDLLAEDGIMLIHTIGWAQKKRASADGKSFVFKHIFPGAELPHASDFTEQSDRWHLEDWQSFGKSYARTARCWLHNLGDYSGLDGFDDTFKRKWEYYLLSCTASFERRRTKLWQLVFTKTASSRPDDAHHIRT